MRMEREARHCRRLMGRRGGGMLDDARGEKSRNGQTGRSLVSKLACLKAEPHSSRDGKRDSDRQSRVRSGLVDMKLA